MKYIKCTITAIALVLSTNVNATIINTLNGITYEWMEISATLNMTRDQVEAQLTDVNSELYGYEYASRGLVEELLLSYSSWDGLSGWHGDTNVVTGIESFITDFGITSSSPGDGFDGA